jgi:hypothetical protein
VLEPFRADISSAAERRSEADGRQGSELLEPLDAQRGGRRVVDALSPGELLVEARNVQGDEVLDLQTVVDDYLREVQPLFAPPP